MKLVTMLLAVFLVVGVVACGDDSEDENGAATTTTETAEEASGEPVALSGEETLLALDPDTARVLEQNDVAVAPVDPAAPDGDAIAFPITGGELEVEELAGTIEHEGGLTFSAGNTDVEVTDFVVDTVAGTLTASTADGELPLLQLDPSGLKRSEEGDVIVASGIEASLTRDGAQALNDAFDVNLFERGIPIGEVTLRATGS